VLKPTDSLCWSPLTFYAEVHWHSVLKFTDSLCWSPLTVCAEVHWLSVLKSTDILCWSPLTVCAEVHWHSVLKSTDILCWSPLTFCAEVNWQSVLKSTDTFAVALLSSSRNIWGLPSIRCRVRNCGHSIFVVTQRDKCREHKFCSYIFLGFTFPILYFHSFIHSFIDFTKTGLKISPPHPILKEIKIKMLIHDTNKYNSYMFRRHLRHS